MAKSARSANVLYLEFDGLAIDTDFREFDPGIDEILVDSTAGADEVENQHRIRDTVAPTASILVEDSAAGLLIAAKLEHGTTGNLIWGPRGNTAGYPKWGIEARVKKANTAFSHEAEQVFDVEFVNVGREWLFDGRSDTF
jgi:hypothetical protein